MKIIIPVAPISINKCFQGRRFKTRESKEYDYAVALSIGGNHTPIKADWYEVHYDFHIKNFKMADADNLVKQIQDCIVRAKLIPDDRLIKRFTVEKFKAEEGQERSEVEILAYLREK